jgi:hypothetical protein
VTFFFGIATLGGKLIKKELRCFREDNVEIWGMFERVGI